VPPLLSRDDEGNFEVDRSAIENFLRPPAEELPEDIEVRCYVLCYFNGITHCVIPIYLPCGNDCLGSEWSAKQQWDPNTQGRT
jgi:hypothetical protein